MKCTMPTGNLRQCSREARYLYLVGEGTSENPARTRAAYCAQHDRAGGASAILRVRPWEYEVKHDAVAHIDIARG